MFLQLCSCHSLGEENATHRDCSIYVGHTALGKFAIASRLTRRFKCGEILLIQRSLSLQLFSLFLVIVVYLSSSPTTVLS